MEPVNNPQQPAPTATPPIDQPSPNLLVPKKKNKLRTIILLLVILFLLSTSSVAGYIIYNNLSEKNNQEVACTLEAMICPDGSSVGRTGPNCEFSPCPTAAPNPTANWKTYKNEEYGFEIKFPNGYLLEENGMNSFIIAPDNSSLESGSGWVSEFLYISIIANGFESKGGEIYNYNTTETNQLLKLDINESEVIASSSPDLSSYFTYTRLPNVEINNINALVFLNNSPWNSPPEKRMYLQTARNLYLIGRYALDNNYLLFDQILSTFKLIN